MGILMAINSVAPVLGPIIGSLIITISTWKVIFYLLAIIGLIVTILCILFIKESHKTISIKHGVSKAIFKMLKELTNLKFLLYVVSLSFIMGGFFGYISAAPFVLQVHYKLTPLGFSAAFASITVCIAVASMISGRIVKRVGEVRMVWFSYFVMLVSALSILTIAIFPPKSFIVILVLLMFFCSMMGVSQTAGFTIVMKVRKGDAGAASGIFGVMTFLFGSLTSPLMGLMGDNSIIPLGVCLTLCTIMAILCMRVAQHINND